MFCALQRINAMRASHHNFGQPSTSSAGRDETASHGTSTIGHLPASSGFDTPVYSNFRQEYTRSREDGVLIFIDGEDLIVEDRHLLSLHVKLSAR